MRLPSLAILVFYLVLAGSVSGVLVRDIVRRHGQGQHRRCSVQLVLFSGLAACSLFATWSYMAAFFAGSYGAWQARQGDDAALLAASPVVKWELWLRDTQLFRDAWLAVLETPARVWWSGQIFMWTTAWSVFLAAMARRYRIPYAWMYMLLGQIVAISYAMDLFFLAVLVYRPAVWRGTRAAVPSVWLEIAPVVVSLASAAVVPQLVHTPFFLEVLLVPHLVLFVPPLSAAAVEDRDVAAEDRGTAAEDRGTAAEDRDVAAEDRGTAAEDRGSDSASYKWLFLSILGVALVLQAKTALAVWQDCRDGGACSLRRAFRDHPAVSSVGWDAVLCAVAATAWASLQSTAAAQDMADRKTQ